MAARSEDPTTKPAVPYAGPTWLTVERIARVAVLWPFVGSFVLQALRLRSGWWQQFWGTVQGFDLVALLLVQVLVARRIARASDAKTAARRAFVAQPLICIVYAIGESLRYLSYASWGVWRIALHSVLVGCVLAACQTTTAAVALRVVAARALDTRDRLLVHAGFLAAVSATAIAVLPALCVGEPATSLHNVRRTALAIVAPLVVAAWAWVRLRARQAWIRRVEAGEVRGWRIEPELPDNAADLPPVARRPGVAYTSSRVRVLVHGEDAASPFRDGRKAVPVALVLDDDAAATKGAHAQA